MSGVGRSGGVGGRDGHKRKGIFDEVNEAIARHKKNLKVSKKNKRKEILKKSLGMGLDFFNSPGGRGRDTLPLNIAKELRKFRYCQIMTEVNLGQEQGDQSTTALHEDFKYRMDPSRQYPQIVFQKNNWRVTCPIWTFDSDDDTFLVEKLSDLSDSFDIDIALNNTRVRHPQSDHLSSMQNFGQSFQPEGLRFHGWLLRGQCQQEWVGSGEAVENEAVTKLSEAFSPKRSDGSFKLVSVVLIRREYHYKEECQELYDNFWMELVKNNISNGPLPFLQNELQGNAGNNTSAVEEGDGNGDVEMTGMGIGEEAVEEGATGFGFVQAGEDIVSLAGALQQITLDPSQQ
ncbi:hypothetical protein HYFRA_00011078 [Hymenoscyphus fraxineus]|uniref:Uncharacterized protein n=1 Tax=Hymenoscyphus fraxineus TaxID=746836 RepID=A0A9N9PST4_9HELO|nr:hypothetical protein HYFRA_00011078 [Hymenoscyphus fraxineus]